jgi:uncharacterized protein (DUF1501 family)
MSEEAMTEMPEPGAAGDVHALRCADCARADSADPDAHPVDVVPIPADALVGFPDGVPQTKGTDRRQFLRNGVIGFASVYAAHALNWTSIFEAAVAEAAAGPQNQLVMLYLNGGMDGLNCIVPGSTANFGAYRTARPTLFRDLAVPSTPTRVGSTVAPGTGGELAFANPMVSGAGNNGDTKGLDTLWGDGSGGAGSDLAYLPGMHFLPANGSHFEATDFIFAGALQKMGTGWLGRWLDLYGSTTNPLQAISIGSSLSKTIRSASAPVCSVPTSFQNFGFTVNGVSSSQANINAEVGRLAAVPGTTAGIQRSRSVFGTTVNVSTQLTGGSVTAPDPTGYPASSSLSDRLRTAAALLQANLGVKVVTIDWGSFDTHGEQASTMDPQISTLSRALAAFKDDLTRRGIEQRVITVVFTEFGRRVGENGTVGTADVGTDHGAGGPCFVMGSSVRGGMASNHPSVTSLMNGNLGVTTDFRTVWQSIISDWLGGDPTRVLPGGPFPALSRPDGQTTLFK